MNGLLERKDADDRQTAGDVMAKHTSVAAFHLEQRVQSLTADKGPQLGTVKYVGPVEGYEGVWVGVDWDNGLGRHNGTVDGVTYFESTGKQSGSLVRPHTLTTGIPLQDALFRRYNASESLEPSADEMYVLSVRQRRLAVELVGKEKIEERQKRFDEFYVASLAYAGVCSAGPPGQIQALVPSIKELDLTGNLLPDWPAISRICEELTGLRVLNLSCIRLKTIEGTLPALANLTTLVVNNCNITWKQVVLLRHSLLSLEELHLCGNNIITIEDAFVGDSVPAGKFVEGFESLLLLNLEDNCIENWEEIWKLSNLKRLQQLNLNGNNLKQIFYSGSSVGANEGAKQIPFENLQCLLLGRNNISDSASVDSLDQFPSLKDVRLSENPITTISQGGAVRYILVARMKKITSLNGSEVKLRERKDSEIRYVRYVMTSMRTESLEEISRLHPRYVELKLQYDIPLESVYVGAAVTSQRLADSFLAITFTCVAPSVGAKAPITKKLPSSTTIGQLKHLCERLFKLKVAKQHLYVSDQDSPLPMALVNEQESLADLSLGASAVILVDALNI